VTRISVKRESNPARTGHDDTPHISHLFYTGGRLLRRGDVALCGFVHDSDHPGFRKRQSGSQPCVVCEDLDR
jgi:hypothetical protein